MRCVQSNAEGLLNCIDTLKQSGEDAYFGELDDQFSKFYSYVEEQISLIRHHMQAAAN